MDNQDSSPSIIFPNVPDDFCPNGNWQNVFQEFIDDVLSNGTINVPGLGDVTPEQIAELTQQIAILTDQVSDISGDLATLTTQVSTIPVIEARYGTVTAVDIGDSVRTVTFDALPNTNYGISITPHCSATIAAQPTPLFALVTGSKTTTGFSIRIENNIAEITSIDWMAVHTS
jgi:hypothetical protein